MGTSNTHKPEANGLGLGMTTPLGNPVCQLEQMRIQRESSQFEHHASDLARTQQLQIQVFARDLGSRLSSSFRSPRPQLRSSSGPFRIVLGRLPCLHTIEVTTLLHMPRVRRDANIRDAEEAAGNDFGYFQAIEVMSLYLL